MHSDAVEALIEDDNDLAADVIQRDDDVDRLWYMVSRVFRTVLRNPTTASEIAIEYQSICAVQRPLWRTRHAPRLPASSESRNPGGC